MLVSEVDQDHLHAAAEVNQDSGQELPIAPQGLSRNAKAEQSFMRRFDVNNDGVIDEDEARAAAASSVELRSSLSYARKVAFGALGLMLLSWLGNAGLTAAVVVLAKDTYVKGDTTMSNAKGKVVLTGVATHNLPLIVAPVLPDDELFSVETLRVTLPGSSSGPAEVSSSGEAVNEVGSGETINEASPSVVTSIRMFRISSVEKINSTAVVFHALGGEQIRAWNGVTTVRLSDSGPEIPVCSANVTCAAFQVEGAELAEKYLAKAEALLVPFEEGRRRLAEACRDPFTSVGRDAAQTAAADRCQPTTVAACKALALKNGLTWGYSGAGSYFGCYAFAGNGKAYFGTGGTETQMFEAIEGRPGWSTPLRVPSLDADCLLLSNQAKLEAKLESNHAAIVSKLDPGWARGVLGLAVCLVTENGVETCTSFKDGVEIPDDFARGKTVNGTLKVGPAVTSIGRAAFARTALTGLDISDATALQTIGEYAFSFVQLTGTLKVGPAVTSIGDNAFYKTDLTGIDLSDAAALQTIGRAAFYKNTQLTGTLKVGPAVISIGQYAFRDTDLAELDISEATALTTIDRYAFLGTPLAGQTVRKADGTSFLL